MSTTLSHINRRGIFCCFSNFAFSLFFFHVPLSLSAQPGRDATASLSSCTLKALHSSNRGGVSSRDCLLPCRRPRGTQEGDQLLAAPLVRHVRRRHPRQLPMPESTGKQFANLYQDQLELNNLQRTPLC